MRGVTAAGGFRQRMDAAHKVARLIAVADGHVSSEPAGDRVVDLPDRAVLVDHQHADVDHVEDGLEIGMFLGQGLGQRFAAPRLGTGRGAKPAADEADRHAEQRKQEHAHGVRAMRHGQSSDGLNEQQIGQEQSQQRGHDARPDTAQHGADHDGGIEGDVRWQFTETAIQDPF